MKVFTRSLLKITLVASILLGLGLTTIMAPSGIRKAEAFEPFLDGRFPDVVPTGNLPYAPVFTNITFDSPLTFNEIPSGGKIIIGQRDGKIYWFNKEEEVSEKHLMLDLSTKVVVFFDCGFLCMTLHTLFGLAGFNYL
ncbi:MAG: hypothetical protein AAF242_12840 [Bacteroidota bacterium]